MIIQDLKIENFRCYDFAEITFDKGINLIHGQNGCGKSSLIEAIQLNLSGKSFRTTEIDTIIRKNNSFLQSLVTFEELNTWIMVCISLLCWEVVLDQFKRTKLN